MITELCKCGLRGILVTPGLSTLRAPAAEFAAAVLTNVDRPFVSRCSRADATVLSGEVGGDITADGIVSLDDYTYYARWARDGAEPPAFSFRLMALPLPRAEQRAQAARRSEASRDRYGAPRAQGGGAP